LSVGVATLATTIAVSNRSRVNEQIERTGELAQAFLDKHNADLEIANRALIEEASRLKKASEGDKT
jgi:hypothetical protein